MRPDSDRSFRSHADFYKRDRNFSIRVSRALDVIIRATVGIPAPLPNCARLHLEIIGKHSPVTRAHDQMIVLGRYFGLFDTHTGSAICHANTALRCTIAARDPKD